MSDLPFAFLFSQLCFKSVKNMVSPVLTVNCIRTCCPVNFITGLVVSSTEFCGATEI